MKVRCPVIYPYDIPQVNYIMGHFIYLLSYSCTANETFMKDIIKAFLHSCNMLISVIYIQFIDQLSNIDIMNYYNTVQVMLS